MAEESYPMNGGDGIYSYSKNSSFQKETACKIKKLIDEVIARNFDIKELLRASNSFNIADLGCSVGPNTIISVENIIEAIKQKIISQNLDSKTIEFQVFFNDHFLNDFNTLFNSLPQKREYYSAGVPGTFHGRLFPNSSLHFIHTSTALHWLSQVPQEVLNKDSLAWNKGRISYKRAPNEVLKAYSSQFANDLEIFLESRAKELVVGGILVIIMPSFPIGIPESSNGMNILLESSLVDMVNEGLVSEALLDSFNLPIYTPSLKELIENIERNKSFKIEKMELFKALSVKDVRSTGEAWTMHLRAGFEGMLSKHFGTAIINDLFDRFFKKTQEFPPMEKASTAEFYQVFLALKPV